MFSDSSFLMYSYSAAQKSKSIRNLGEVKLSQKCMYKCMNLFSIESRLDQHLIKFDSKGYSIWDSEGGAEWKQK